MQRTLSLFLSAAALSLSCAVSTAQTLDYQWLNQPCADNLNCSNGCSACNLPAGGSLTFIGANVIWSGMDVCPHPINTGDNAVYTTNWPIDPTPMVYVGLSAVTMEDVQIDSIIIRHRRSADGPQRVRLMYSNDAMQAPDVIGDVESTQTYEESVFTDLGCLTQTQGSDYSGFQLRIQAYQGGADGNWQLDAMRIVARPCGAAQVGIAENFQRALQESSTYVDVLGRPVKGQPAPGMYIGGRKRVQVL